MTLWFVAAIFFILVFVSVLAFKVIPSIGLDTRPKVVYIRNIPRIDWRIGQMNEVGLKAAEAGRALQRLGAAMARKKRDRKKGK